MYYTLSLYIDTPLALRLYIYISLDTLAVNSPGFFFLSDIYTEEERGRTFLGKGNQTISFLALSFSLSLCVEARSEIMFDVYTRHTFIESSGDRLFHFAKMCVEIFFCIFLFLGAGPILTLSVIGLEQTAVRLCDSAGLTPLPCIGRAPGSMDYIRLDHSLSRLFDSIPIWLLFDGATQQPSSSTTLLV